MENSVDLVIPKLIFTRSVSEQNKLDRPGTLKESQSMVSIRFEITLCNQHKVEEAKIMLKILLKVLNFVY